MSGPINLEAYFGRCRQLAEAYNLGYRAYADGTPLTACPEVGLGRELAREWRDGWRNAKLAPAPLSSEGQS